MSTYYPRCVALLEPILDDFKRTATDSLQRQARIVVVPTSAEWESRPPCEADTARVEVSWKDLPLDPRILRDVRIEIAAWDAGRPDADFLAFSSADIVFTGFVDEPTSDHGEQGQTVTLTARGFQGRLMDTSSQTTSVDASKQITRIIRDVIRESGVPGFDGITIRTPDGDPALKSLTGKGTWTPPSNATVWDVIVAVCRAAGLRCFFRLTELVIEKPKRPDVSNANKFVYGSNVQRLSFKRDLRPLARKAVRLRAYDPTTRTLVEATFPSDAKEIVTLQEPDGPWTARTLKDRAESIYNALGVREMRGSLDTVALEDLDGDPVSWIRAGDVLSVRLTGGGGVEADEIHGMSRSALVDLLVRRRIKRSVAEALADAWKQAEGGGLTPGYLVERARHRWSATEGLSASLDFTTFVIPE